MSGLVAGGVVGERLHPILFTAPALHHFGSWAGVVERIIEPLTFE